MASKKNEGRVSYTNFDEILKRGSATVPRNFRPVPHVTRHSKEDTDFSLNGAVMSANAWGNKSPSPNEHKQRKSKKKRSTGNEESGFSSDGSRSQSRKRTPMTIPRTKVNSATPLEQQIALKRLKQRLDFEDQKVEPKNTNLLFNGDLADDLESIESSNVASETGESDANLEIDVEKIDDRLEQVRDYIKQATGMYLSLSMDATNPDPKRSEQLTKLGKLIQQLRIQEKGYLDLLQKTKIQAQQTTGAEHVLENGPSEEVNEEGENLSELVSQQQELERLREQQALLKKIVEQQKELQQLKDRQSTLLEMQERAEQCLEEHRHLQSAESGQSQSEGAVSKNMPKEDELFSETSATNTSNNATDSEDTDIENIQRRIELESKLTSLNEKKQQMDELMTTLKQLKESHTVESRMKGVLNDNDLSEVAAEVLANPVTDEDDDDASESRDSIKHKISSLNDVRQRLQQLKNIVSSYESGSQQAFSQANHSKDNRLHAQSMQGSQKQGNTLTGVGGARLRLDPNVNNQDVLLKDLQSLQSNIEELMDNRNRPIPQGIQRNQIDVTRNPPLKNKNTNQEKRQPQNTTNSYSDNLRELKDARKQFDGASGRSNNMPKPNNIDRAETTESERDSDLESNSSSALQWQDDPEFQNKVQKLKMAKEKLHRLQELVKVVQQGGGPNLPIDDLEDLTLTLSDEQIGSEYGESEEEEDEGDESDDEEEEDEEDECEDDDEGSRQQRSKNDGVESAGEQSDISKSTTTDVNYNFASENGLSDNERRYQGLLRKQRLELNYLLKERERLLEAQRKLSDLAGQASVEEFGAGYSSQKKSSSKQKQYPKLTKAQLSKQDKLKKGSSKESTMRRLFPKLDRDEFYGSEHEIYPPEQAPSDLKQPIAAALSNPMAVSEIRRQRDLFEERKKQKFVEKQRRKKQNHNEENQSEDRETYVINSDIDEGVGVSMYSADVTTAATWGGSTEQSSDEEDSAVGDDEDVNGEDDEFGSQFDQVEEEEEEEGGSNVPPLFKVKKYDEEPVLKKKNRGIGSSVSWSLDVSPPRSRKRPRQGNLTPAHKLIQDNNNKRNLRQNARNQQQPLRKPNLKPFEPKLNQNGGEVQSQLATMCSSLLRNEHTLLQMLQNQMQGSNREGSSNVRQGSNVNQTVLSEIQDFFRSSNYNESYQQTLTALRSTYERIEQHQLDMEYLRQQFEKLNTSQTVFGASNFQSPWPNPPSLHFSSFGPVSTANAPKMPAGASNVQSPNKPFYQKETQTETSLFDEPFKPYIQPYTLFGEAPGDVVVDENQSEDFNFGPLMEPTSPGVVGDRTFTHQQEDIPIEELFPYRLRVSEYNPMSFQGNPLSFQGNFANTITGTTMTVSTMSMNKKNDESKSNDDKSIWPSFFKMADHVDEKTPDENPSDSVAEANENAPRDTTEQTQTGDGATGGVETTDGNASLFDALRDSIYSEVATLIAMNESRPHYLIELFRELQLLNSDYLRQRALYSLQELVTRYLTDENLPTDVSPSKGAAFSKETLPGHQWVASGSEQTPSDLASVITTTDDEYETEALQTLKQQMQNNTLYDYAEVADSESDANLSTPGSHADIPFAAEDLGNTVINLEDALQRIRTDPVEGRNGYGKGATHASTPQQQAAFEAFRRRNNLNMDNASTSSAGDVMSDASSDMPQPSVDTQKLDQQIKAVMIDLIPFLNENIENTCTEEFLDKVRNLIVEFAKEKEPGSEDEQFGRFFHTQLDSILRDSLTKFNSRKLKECGEDILIDVSEILFNELAFYRLMQDLDRPGYGSSSQRYPPRPNENNQSNIPFANRSTMYDDSSAAESTDVQNTGETDDGDVEEEEPEDLLVSKPSNSSGASGSSSNAFVMIDSVTYDDNDDDDTESSRQFVKVELSVSETRPVRSSGSGEEDVNEEEPTSFSTAPAPPSSIHTYSQVVASGQVDTEDASETRDVSIATEDDRDEGDQQQEDDRSEHEREAPPPPPSNNNNDGQEDRETVEEGNPENDRAEDQRDLGEPESNMAMSGQNNVVVEQEATEGDQQIEQAESIRQQNEIEEAAEDDLPEADMVSEDNNPAQVVLAHMDGLPELAGDGNAVPPPAGSPRR